MADLSTRWTRETRLTNSQAVAHVRHQVICSPYAPGFSREQSTHTSDSPLPVNQSPTDLHTGISKESPSILNSPPTYTSYTVPTPSISLILEEKLASPTHSIVISIPLRFLHTYFVAIRENKFGLSVKSNQGFRGGSSMTQPPCYQLQLSS